MKFCFNGGGFRELIETLKRRDHTILAGVPIWYNYAQNKQRKNYNKLLKEYVMKNKPDVYVCVKGYRNGPIIYPETTEFIKKHVGITIYWSQDDPFFVPAFINNHIYSGYTIALSCSTASFGEYRKVGIKPYLFWPAWDSSVYRHIKPVEETNKIDIIFVGTPYACTNIPRKDLLLWAVKSGLKIEIYGSTQWITNKKITNARFGTFIQGDSRLAPYYKGLWNNWGDLPNLFCKARINISNHVIGSAPMYLNDRVFLVMGSGNCLVMDHPPGIETVFTHNKDLIFYENMETFIHRTSYYLKHINSRNRICINAKNKILKAHTYKHRAQQLLSILAKNGFK